MAVRLIAGRAGAGKTHWCRSQICEALASSLVDGPRLVMLVPEQAALQMERELLTMSPVRALGRCEVLSFRRLARRVLQTSRAGMPVLMTPLGRQMALRHLVGRRRESLQEFRGVADRTGFLDGLSQTIVELMREAVAVDRVEDAAEEAAAASDPSGPRLHDIALVYRAYLEYLGSARVDPEGVLDLARAGLSRTAWLADAEIWMDGFAGLSHQQVRMVAALAQRAGRVNVSMLVDPSSAILRGTDREPDDLSLFARSDRTWTALARAVRAAGVTIEEPLLLGTPRCLRYAEGSPLAALERRLFSVPCGPEPSDAEQTRADSSSPPTPPSAGVRLLRAADRRAEVDAAVRTLVDLVQSPTAPMRYRDIAVVVRDLSLYHDLLSAALRAHGVPFFIDRRRPTHHHPLIELVRAVLAMRGDEGFGPAVAMLLKTGLSGLADASADALENYQLAYGLMSAASWEEQWDYSPPGTWGRADSAKAAEAAALEAVVRSRDVLRERIGAWWPGSGSAKGRPSFRTWAERLSTLLERFDVAARLESWCDQAADRGDLDEAAEHEQVWSDLMKLLDELAATLGEERVNGREFQAVVESALADFTLGLVPPTLDQVLVSSIERSRHPAVRAAFVLGFSDGQFPLRLTEDVVIRDEERAWLARSDVTLGRTRSQRVLDERMLAYIALTRPSEFLWVSYPDGDETGRALSPSPYWGALRAALPVVPVETIDASGPESVSTTSGLAGRLGLHLRTWCEGTPDAEDAASWLALYRWAIGEETVRGVRDRIGGGVPRAACLPVS
ncbi:MAG: PD-(D/E)XK nuclease family protein, partial [Phycisphaerae bacterium]